MILYGTSLRLTSSVRKIFATCSSSLEKTLLSKPNCVSTKLIHNHHHHQIVRNQSTKVFPRKMEATINSNEINGFLPMLEGNEINFDTPYGIVAGKEYGNPDGLPVLAVHGWLDNCGSFDPLWPYIVPTNNLHVVSIDTPGCGLSSHKPAGSDYCRWFLLKDMKRIVDTLGWKKFSIIGHSEGGHYALLFGALFPDMVDRVVSIDIYKPITYITDNWAEKMAKIVEMHLKNDQMYMKDPTLESSAPIHSESQALQKLMEAHGNSITMDSARVLFKRGTKKLASGYVFTRDIRLKLPGISPYPDESTIYSIMESMKSDLLIIRATKSIYFKSEEVRNLYATLYEKNCRMFRDSLLEGTHHLHMNNPDIVGQEINQFFSDSIKLDNPEMKHNL